MYAMFYHQFRLWKLLKLFPHQIEVKLTFQSKQLNDKMFIMLKIYLHVRGWWGGEGGEAAQIMFNGNNKVVSQFTKNKVGI